MTLNKPVKISVAVSTIWIILYPFLFFAAWLSMMSGFMFADSSQAPTFMFSFFPVIFPLHCLTIIIQFALMGFYLFHVIKNVVASDVIRVILGVGIFFMPFIAMPVYYYLFIWREEPPDWALAKKTDPGLSTVDNRTEGNEIVNPKKQSNLSKTNKVIIGGVVGIVVLMFLVVAVVLVRFITTFNRTMQENIFAEPTPVIYQSVPMYSATEKPYYHPVNSSSFTEVNVFKGITTWSDYNQIPILIKDDMILISGHIQQPTNSWGRINVDIVSANIDTGNVNWQALVGSAFLLQDGQYVYTEAINNYGPTGMVAYNINTGEKAWETRFDQGYAVGISHLQVTETDIKAETYEHGNYAVYTLDKKTGVIKEVEKDTTRYAVDEELSYKDIILEKKGYGVPDTIIARKKTDDSFRWTFKKPVVSNIAIGGSITYFLTDDVKLMALDTETGEILGTLSFAPSFPHDFDFVNTSLIVTAEKNTVAIYFEDSKQLSVFRFNHLVE